MLILADITEERHLPPSLKEHCKFVPGLEDLTGADFVISPLSIPFGNESLLLRHAKKGLCVQRKNIGDFVQSFTDEDNRLWFQLSRLHKVTKMPWLLLVGDLKCDRDGHAVIDGRESGWEYQKIISALEWWEVRGGYYTWLSRESLIAGWCKNWHGRMTNRDEEGKWGTKFISRPVGQTLYELPAVSRTLMTLPGMGEERAAAVHDRAQKKIEELGDKRLPTLMDCFMVIQDEKVEGVGEKTRERVLKYIGWEIEE